MIPAKTAKAIKMLFGVVGPEAYEIGFQTLHEEGTLGGLFSQLTIYKHCNVLICCVEQVYLLTPMDRATLLHTKSTITHCPPSIITRQRASVDSNLLHSPINVGYYHIFER